MVIIKKRGRESGGWGRRDSYLRPTQHNPCRRGLLLLLRLAANEGAPAASPKQQQ